MAHAAVHFVVGATAATAWRLPSLWRAWRRGAPLARRLTEWVAASWIMGALAVAPPLLRRLGMPPEWTAGWWMNLFFLHPLITRLWRGGGTIGPLLLLVFFAAQYALILAALRRRRERP